MDTMVRTRPRKPTVSLCVVSALLTFLAFISIVGSFLFSYPLGGIEGWATGIVLDVGGVLMAYCAYRLPAGDARAYRIARWLMGAEFCWCFYKVFIYGETESSVFFLATVLAIVLLVRPSMRRYHAALQ